jgi:SAM-dependent methyltransferase
MKLPKFFIPYLLSAEIIDCAIDYNFDGMKKGTKVLDVGAGHGGFSFIAEKYGSDVIAVEPLQLEFLKIFKFINRCNFKIIPIAHGDGEPLKVMWGIKEKIVPTYNLTQIFKKSFIPDFIKIDTEGTEWTIQSKELLEIPRFEIEFHFPPHVIPYDINLNLINELSNTHNIYWTNCGKMTRIAHGFKKL